MRKIALAAAEVCALVLILLLRVGCGKSPQVNPLGEEAQQERLSKQEQDRNERISNLKVLYAAKHEWRLARNKQKGDPVVEAEVNTCMKGG